MNIKSYAIAISGIAIASVLNAAYVTETEASAVAAGFASRDKIGARVLGGMTLKEISKRGNLWIASFMPSGHVIVNGTDLADPIVGFSVNDFAEPEPESPAYAMLGASSSAVDALEKSGGERNPRWDALQHTSSKTLLKAADAPSEEAIIVEPFLESHYNQWQPYNDYCPIYNAATNTVKPDLYRGRAPCGCVATAAAQIYKHFSWPARIDTTASCDHESTLTNGTMTTFPIRFDGHVPPDWTTIATNYIAYTTNLVQTAEGLQRELIVDLRGNVSEAVRYPIARLIMWMDVNAQMQFSADGSNAFIAYLIAAMSEWYTLGEMVDINDEKVVSDLMAGIPVAVQIYVIHDENVYSGHLVVGHGWASDEENSYIYLNYGWGGANDAYYNTDSSAQDMEFMKNQTLSGHYPRAKPQLSPLPNVCGTTVGATWSFPDIHTNKLEGFTVSVAKTGSNVTNLYDNFECSHGVSNNTNIFVTTDGDLGYDGNLLHVNAATLGTYTYPDTFMLTSASELSFNILSYAAYGAVLEAQVRFGNGDWETVSTPLLRKYENSSGWTTERIYLGDHGGETAQFRFRSSFNFRGYNPECKILVDDVTIENVIPHEETEKRHLPATTRSIELANLEPGANYSVSVEPIMPEGTVAGEASQPVTFDIEGERRTPVAGDMTYVETNCSFSADDPGDHWAFYSDSHDGTMVSGLDEVSVSFRPHGLFTSDSILSFSWSATGYYDEESYDSFSVSFTSNDGTSTTLWETNNVGDHATAQEVSIPLGEYAGKSGALEILFYHYNTQDEGGQSGGRIYSPKVTNVLVGTVPEVAFETRSFVALGMPEFKSATSVKEGFYAECGTNATTLAVICSSNVTALAAHSSHPSLLADKDIAIEAGGNGRFFLSLTPSGIDETNYRSRMILTLVATDANGTAAYKDLSLRFDSAGTSGQVAKVVLATSSGTQTEVSIPASWFETYSLSYAEEDKDTATGLNGDFDNDGLSNWAEYVCGTSPTDADEKLECTIEIIDGAAKVEYSPKTLRYGYKTILRGTDDLDAALKDWTVVTTETSTLHFYRVEVVPE